MRNTLYIVLLHISLIACIQVARGQHRESANVESRRADILPCISAQEAAGDKSGAMRYAIPVIDWECEAVLDAATFSSSFYSPFSWKGRQAILSIESASAPYTVFIGDDEVGSNMTPSMPAQFNVTRYVGSEKESSIVILMRGNSRTAKIEGWTVSDDLKLGDVIMLSQPTMYVRDIDMSVERLSGVLNAQFSIVVKSEALNPRISRISYDLLNPAGQLAHRGYTDVTLDMRRSDSIYFSVIVPDSLAWSADDPNLYRLNISTKYRGRYVEHMSFNVGLRSVEMQDDGTVLINGTPQSLKACKVANIISPAEMQLLKDHGYNTLKVDAGELNRDLYKLADSIGMYVIATAPINTSRGGRHIEVGGNPSNDPERTYEYIERSAAIYDVTKFYSSVIAYSLADESLNGINLYESYLYLKGREKYRPIIYLDGGGQWNSDHLEMELDSNLNL